VLVGEDVAHGYSDVQVLVGEDVAHGYPDVLDLDSLIQELLPLALLRVLPVSVKPAVE